MYYRRRSPLTRLVALAILVGGLALAGVKIKGAIHNSQAVDSEAQRLSQLAEGGLGSSYLIERNFKAALDGVRARIGPHAKMLQVQVNPTSVEFQYFVGQRAAGFTANSVQPQLAPEQVTLDSDQSVKHDAFPLTAVRPNTPTLLVAEIKHRPGLSDFRLDGATLAHSPVDGRLGWSVAGTGGGRSVVFLARADGSHLTSTG